MTGNVGKIDRIIRIVIALLLAFLYYRWKHGNNCYLSIGNIIYDSIAKLLPIIYPWIWHLSGKNHGRRKENRTQKNKFEIDITII